MAGILDMLTSQLGKEALSQIAGKSGIDASKIGGVVTVALPLLLTALASGAEKGGGANALFKALDKDHDASAVDNAAGFLKNANIGEGGKILNHVLGDRADLVSAGVSKLSGVNPAQVSSVLALLAPVVMSALAKSKDEGGLNAQGILGLLQGAKADSESRSPQLLGALSSLLDTNGDGQIADDILKLGGGLLKGFLK